MKKLRNILPKIRFGKLIFKELDFELECPIEIQKKIDKEITEINLYKKKKRNKDLF